MDAVDELIIKTIERITHPHTGAFERVYPRHVTEFLPVVMSVRTVRGRMARLARGGEILRLGHNDGYVCHDRGRLALEETLAKKLDAARALSLEITKLREMMLQVKVA